MFLFLLRILILAAEIAVVVGWFLWGFNGWLVMAAIFALFIVDNMLRDSMRYG